MFCMECGSRLPEHAKFCSECGTRLEREPSPDQSSPQTASTVDGSSSVVTTESPENNARRRAIIDSADVTAMAEMARAAIDYGDLKDANFWYLEWITAPGADRSTLVRGVNEYIERVLTHESRFAEAELYLTWVSETGTSEERKAATTALQALHRTRGAKGLKRYRCDKEWMKVDISQPVDPHWTGEMQHRRAIAWLEDRSSTSDMSPLLNGSNPEFLPYLTGMLIGLRDSLGKIGADIEAAIQGLGDWIAYRKDEEERLRSRAREAEMRASKPKPTPTPKQAKPVPSRNSLGEHIDRLFDDKKFAAQIKSVLRCTSGLNDDVIVAAIPVSGKLGDGEDSNHLMLFTYEMAAIVKKPGVFASGEEHSFSKKQISEIGVGDSDHYEGMGFGGRATNWVSLTISLKSGLSYTRHYFLGRNEDEVNSNIPFLRDAFQRMGTVGYRIGDGPGWSSTGGYHRSIGYGIGVWR